MWIFSNVLAKTQARRLGLPGSSLLHAAEGVLRGV